MFEGKKILITGGTGTLGLFLVEYLLVNYSELSEVIIFSRDEYKQFEIKLKKDFAQSSKLRFIIGDVRDLERLTEVFEGVHFIVHAAAIKQVSTAQENQSEAYKTNVLGTKNVLRAAELRNIEKLVFISSDKAVEPINYYGFTKKEGEELVLKSEKVKSVVLRLGNLIGSRGSVLEAFEYQSKLGILKVSDLNVERLFITLEKASKAIMVALESKLAYKIFVPSISSKTLQQIVDENFPNLPVQLYGLKPYERLTEKLFTEGEAVEFIF